MREAQRARLGAWEGKSGAEAAGRPRSLATAFEMGVCVRYVRCKGGILARLDFASEATARY